MLTGYGKRPPVELELPETVHVVPSKHNPWRAAKAKGARFTYHQLAMMRQGGMDPETVEVVRCRSQATHREMYWGPQDSAPVYVFDCPILAVRADGFRLVIAPAGDRKLVHESGEIRAGKKRWKR